MMEVVVTTGAIRRAKFQSDRHHQQTNQHPVFTGHMPLLLSIYSVTKLKENDYDIHYDRLLSTTLV